MLFARDAIDRVPISRFFLLLSIYRKKKNSLSEGVAACVVVIIIIIISSPQAITRRRRGSLRVSRGDLCEVWYAFGFQRQKWSFPCGFYIEGVRACVQNQRASQQINPSGQGCAYGYIWDANQGSAEWIRASKLMLKIYEKGDMHARNKIALQSKRSLHLQGDF